MLIITTRLTCVILIYNFVGIVTMSEALLYPRDSETRDQRSLDGIWNFVLAPQSDPNKGSRELWQLHDIQLFEDAIPMPVPASYNDITQERRIRDHVGIVWYDRKFYVPSTWNNSETRIWVRFGSVHYLACVWVNSELAVSHEVGHLPFEADITQFLQYGENKITVSIDNRLDQYTVPQGTLSNVTTDSGEIVLKQSYTFDFFNYAGIHRPVVLYTTPRIYISDITTNVTVKDNKAIIDYDIEIKGYDDADEQLDCQVGLLDKTNNYVGYVDKKATEDSCRAQVIVENPNLWWPYLMHSNPGYLYTLEVKLVNLNNDSNTDATVGDVYRQPIGIRTLKWTNTSFLINDRPIYFRGLGRHEDSDIRGKGLDLALITKDYNLIKWLGANAYRTSHYPYAEEIMDFADQNGIMIIDECPSVDTTNFSPVLLEKHKQSLTELIRRDKNRPSVVAWSIANEPRTTPVLADEYFGSVAQHVRNLDGTRPVTLAIANPINDDKAVKHLDIISFNRYNGWYQHEGQIDEIVNNVVAEATKWNKKYNKPVLMAEYGADTMEGLHFDPHFIWSEDYQVALLSRHFEAFDKLRKLGFFIGEFIWNFADFKTRQQTTRVGGNKKGIFTRNRQPKASAHHLRRRYFVLGNILENATLPNDLFPYIYQ